MEQALSKLLLVAEVQCTFDVSAIVLVLEATVNDYFVVIAMIIGAIKDLHERRMTNAWQAFRLIGREVRKLEGRSIIDIHHGLQSTRLIAILVLFRIHHVTRVFEHAERPSELAWSRPGWRTSRLADGGKGRTIGTSRDTSVEIEGLWLRGKQRTIRARAAFLGRRGSEALVQTQ